VVRAVGEETWARFRAVGRPLDRKRLEALSPLLILAPHPDDETLGCGGLIATTSDMRLRPRVAYLTDGAASHLGSRIWPPARLAAERQIEALEALRVLGVPASDVSFLRWPDAAPHEPETTPYRETVTTLVEAIRRARVRSLWAPWGGESHSDHVAAAGLAAAAAKAADIIVMSYLIWGWQDPALPGAVRLGDIWTLDCTGTGPRRRQALSCHRTQTTSLIEDASEAFRIPPQLAALTERTAEVFIRAA